MDVAEPRRCAGLDRRFQALIDTELDDRWLRGDTSTEEVAAIFAADLDTTVDTLTTHIGQLCRDVHFYENAWDARTRAGTSRRRS